VGSYQRKLERDLEQRIVGILEPAVGVGEVVARVTASLDTSEINTLADVVDPEATVLRSERTVAQNQNQDSTAKSGIAGAAANQPLSPQPSASGGGTKSASNSQEETRNYEISKTTTKTVTRSPRLQRISVAILLDGIDGKPRSDAEVARLGELARSAVGINQARGDVFNISSSVFSRSSEEASAAEPTPAAIPKNYLYGGAGAGALLIAVLVVMLARRGRAGDATDADLLRPGAKVAELESPATGTVAALPPKLEEPAKAPVDPALAFRDRAQQLAKADPVRAAHLLRAWIASDGEAREAARG
jgi:flagellar M-ring protein FliF